MAPRLMRSTLLDVAKDEVVDLSELSRTGALYEAGRGSVGKHCRFVGDPRCLGRVYRAGFGILTFYLRERLVRRATG